MGRNKHTSRIKKRIDSWKINDYDWASNFIYGIEADYRLVKTTKVSCFLNGDGEANIFNTNGLQEFGVGNFSGHGLLSEKNQFDLILANPPYSVSNFLTQLSDSEKNQFELTKYITPASNKIEMFFIERTMQCLKEKGIFALILPASVFSIKDRIAVKAREMLFSKSDIKAIAKMNERTFMATRTNTYIVFGEKNEKEYLKLKNKIIDFYKDNQDFSWNNVENVVSKYLKKINDNEKQFSNIKDYSNYCSTLDTDAFLIENERLILYIKNINKLIPIIDSGKTQNMQEKFLGYKWSDRKGKEGMKEEKNNEMFNKENILDDSKANYYILNSFLFNEIKPVNCEFVHYVTINDLFNFNSDFNFNTLTFSNPKKWVSNFNLIKLSSIFDFPPKSNHPASFGKEKGKYPFFTSGKSNKWVDEADHNKPCIIIGDGGQSSINFSEKFSASDHNFILCSKENDIEYLKFIYYMLRENFEILTYGLGETSGLNNISKPYIENLELPLPPRETLLNFNLKYEKLLNKIKNKQEEITKIKLKQKDIFFLVIKERKFESKKVKDILEKIEVGKDMPKGNDFSKYKTKDYCLPIVANDVTKIIHGYTKKPNNFNNENTLTLSARGTIGHPEIREYNYYPIVRLLSLFPKSKKVDIKWLYYNFLFKKIQKEKSTILQLTGSEISNLDILVPNLNDQKEIVNKIEKLNLQINFKEKEIINIQKEMKLFADEIGALV